MNLNLAQFLVTADTPANLPGGVKAADQTPGGLGLSFPNILNTETEVLDGIPVPLAMFMPTLAEEPAGAGCPDGQGKEGSGPPPEGSQAEATLPVLGRPVLTLGQQENPLPVHGGKETLTGNQTPAGEPFIQVQDPEAVVLPRSFLPTPLVSLGDRAARLPAGQNLYQQPEALPAEETGKWMHAHRHLVLRADEAGAGTAVRVQPLPGTQGMNPSDPISTTQVTKPLPVAVSVDKLGYAPPPAQPGVEVPYPVTSAENLTSQPQMEKGQLQGNPVQPGQTEAPTATPPEVSPEMAASGEEAAPSLTRHLHQNMTVQTSGLPPLADSLTPEGKPLEVLTGQTAKAAEPSGPDLPGSIRTQVMNQVASRLEVSPEGEKLTIKLEPAHLGKVEVQLTGEKDNLTIVLKASGQEAEQALQKGIKELTENILDRSQRWQHVEIRVDARETPEERNQGRSQENRDQSRQPGQDGKRDQDGRGRDRRNDPESEQASGGRPWA